MEIEVAASGDLVVYTDGRRHQEGRVGHSCHADGNGAGSVAVGSVAAVWDEEVAGIQQALRLTLDVSVLVLLNSKPAQLGIRQAAKSGHGRTRDLVEVVDEVGRRTGMGLDIWFWLVKAHIGIWVNECAELMAKTGC